MLYLLSKQMNRVTFFTTIFQTWVLNVAEARVLEQVVRWSEVVLFRGQETEPQIIPSMSERMFE